MTARKKTTPTRPLKWWETWAIKALDKIQGVDSSLDKDGRLRKTPKMTPAQLKRLKEEDPKAYKEYLRDPYKFLMNQQNKGGLQMKDYSKKRPDQKKKKKMAMGGMMPMKEKKINPTTGMSMNKGGMTDMRKTGMFYGGMARKK